jgi:hypothetical protein
MGYKHDVQGDCALDAGKDACPFLANVMLNKQAP